MADLKPPNLSDQPTSKSAAWTFAAAIIFAGTAWLVYARAINSPFIFDDTSSITENDSVARLWPPVGDAEHPGPLSPASDLPTSGRPLVNLCLALNYQFGQLNPDGYHVFNIIVHILSSLLLMAILRRTLCLDFFGGRFERASGPLAFIAALLWMLHPLQTETVVYITQRTELMVGLFYLATLYCSSRYWAAASQAVRITWLVLATLACCAGMACKEVMVTAPVIVLLFERTFISGSFWRALKNSWPLYIGLCLGWVLLYWLNISAPRSKSAGFHLEATALAWWFTQAKVLLMYLKLTVWPQPLSIHYDIPYLETVSAAWPWLMIVALLGIATLVLLWRRTAVGFVGAWVLIILSPTIVVPIVTEVAAERRMYLPLAALIALAVVGGFWLVQQFAQRLAPAQRANSRPRWPEFLAAAFGLLLCLAASAASANRLTAYHDVISMWQNALDSQPDNALAHNNLGTALADKNRPQEAIPHFRKALELKPRYPEAIYNLGLALATTGDLPQAISFYHQALTLRPNYPEAHDNLGIALAMSGHRPQAIEEFKLVLKQKPNQVKARNNLGIALVQEGKLNEAIEQYEHALRLKPDYAQVCHNLAQAYADVGRFAEAQTTAQRALELARAQQQTRLAQNLEAWLTTDYPELIRAHGEPSSKSSPSP